MMRSEKGANSAELVPYFYASPLGLIEIGVVRDEGKEFLSHLRLSEGFPSMTTCPFSDIVYRSLIEYLQGNRTRFQFPLRPKGTPFQLAVWQALFQIPYGETRSYGDIAAAIGHPKSARAVGQAIHRNPIWIVIPCHRVIGSRGNLTGYAGGLPMKASLLRLERTQNPPQK